MVKEHDGNNGRKMTASKRDYCSIKNMLVEPLLDNDQRISLPVMTYLPFYSLYTQVPCVYREIKCLQ